MGGPVNLNSFGFDSYKDLQSEIRNTKDDDGIRMGSQRSEYSNQSIFNADDTEVTKDDFLGRLEELGLDDNIAEAMWEVMNIDSDGDSEDVLDSDEIDKLINLYGASNEINGKDDDSDDGSVSIRSFSEHIGAENAESSRRTKNKDKTQEIDSADDTKETSSTKGTSSTSQTSNTQGANSNSNIDNQGYETVSLDELDTKKYSPSNIKKDKDKALEYQKDINKALEKINNSKTKPDDDVITTIAQGEKVKIYAVDIGDDNFIKVEVDENGKPKQAHYTTTKDGQTTYLANIQFNEDGLLHGIFMDEVDAQGNKGNDSFAEKTAIFNAKGELELIAYDANENKNSEAVANFKEGQLSSIKISSDDNGKFDKEFTLDSNGKYEKGYKLDENGNRIQIQQPQQQTSAYNQQTGNSYSYNQPTVSNKQTSRTQSSSSSKGSSGSQSSSSSQASSGSESSQASESSAGASESNANALSKEQEEVISKGKKFKGEHGNIEYILYNGQVYNPDGSKSTKMSYALNNTTGTSMIMDNATAQKQEQQRNEVKSKGYKLKGEHNETAYIIYNGQVYNANGVPQKNMVAEYDAVKQTWSARSK